MSRSIVERNCSEPRACNKSKSKNNGYVSQFMSYCCCIADPEKNLKKRIKPKLSKDATTARNDERSDHPKSILSRKNVPLGRTKTMQIRNLKVKKKVESAPIIKVTDEAECSFEDVIKNIASPIVN